MIIKVDKNVFYVNEEYAANMWVCCTRLSFFYVIMSKRNINDMFEIKCDEEKSDKVVRRKSATWKRLTTLVYDARESAL